MKNLISLKVIRVFHIFVDGGSMTNVKSISGGSTMTKSLKSTGIDQEQLLSM